jgi:glycosyltransferase involved in cell wall biosynthesis
MIKMFGYRNKEFSKILSLLDIRFYSSVYGLPHKRAVVEEHFKKNYESGLYDPNAKISITLLCDTYSLEPKALVEKMTSDVSFYEKCCNFSNKVMEHFDVDVNGKLISDLEILKTLVDERYYLSKYPDVANTWIPAHVHYYLFGEKEARLPNSWFRVSPLPKGLRSKNALLEAHNLGLIGSTNSEQDRVSLPCAVFFDEDYYLEENEDVLSSGVDSYHHYISHGENEGRWPNPYFDPIYYWQVNSDVLEAGLSAFEHYTMFGWKEGREYCGIKSESSNSVVESDLERGERTTAVDFDEKYYIEKYPDVVAAGVNSEWHYWNFGERECREPNQYFSPSFYLDTNADVRVAEMSPFEHFRSSGFSEGRLGIQPQFRESFQGLAPLLFVGHDGMQAGSQVVLFEIIKWFSENTLRPIKTLLLCAGPMTAKYAEYSEVYTLHEYQVDDSDALKAFLNEKFEFCYFNTVIAGRFFNLAKEAGIELTSPVISHIHEMEKIILENFEAFSELKARTSHYISASYRTTEDLISVCGVKNENITTVPAFINVQDSSGEKIADLRNASREYLSVTEEDFLVIGCGTVYWRKSPDIFVNVATKILHGNNKCVFVWIGDGPDIDEVLAGVPDEYRDRIRFVGARNDASSLLAAADLFFLPSREDPFPLVVMEAAQHKVPALCFGEATGIVRFIGDDAGYVVDKIDADKAVECIEYVLANSEDRIRRGHIARSRVLSTYTSEIQCWNIFSSIFEKVGVTPSVSVIVPFYNQEKYIDSRLKSIFDQSVKDIELILLDDCSSDDTAKVLENYRHKYCRVSNVVINKNNSGSTFNQWKLGLGLARASIVWIAEGDDLCDESFLSKLLPYFNDQMVNIASGKTEIIDENDNLKENALKPYFNAGCPGRYLQSFKCDGFVEVEIAMSAMCTLVNASGLLLRKSSIEGRVLDEAQDYQICGDWLVYLSMLKSGKLAYDVGVNNYFRRHSTSVVSRLEGGNKYFKERFLIARKVLEDFAISLRAKRRIIQFLEAEWKRFLYKNLGRSIEDFIDLGYLKSLPVDTRFHGRVIAFYVHGMMFSKGGIERLAAMLANHWVSKGCRVIIYCKKSNHKKSVYPLFENVELLPIFDEREMESSVSALRSSIISNNVELFIPMLSESLFDPVVSAADSTGIKVIASEHNDPWEIQARWWNKKDRDDCFSKVDRIHLLLDLYKDSLSEENACKAVVIPNAVEKVDVQLAIENLIIGVGRLADQKRFDRFLKVISLAQEWLRNNHYGVEIYGEGPLEAELLSSIDELGVRDLVSLKGKTDTMEAVYARAKCLLMTSDFEGFPLTLLEAGQYGLPVLGFKSCKALSGLIGHLEVEFLFDSEEELAHNMIAMLDDDKLVSFARETSKMVLSGYSVEDFYIQWDLLVLEELTNV